MAEKKKNTRVRKSTKEELSYMIDGVKEEITNVTRDLVVNGIKGIKNSIVEEVKGIIKSSEKKLNAKVRYANANIEKKLNDKVEDVTENVDRLEKSIKGIEYDKDVELVEVNPVIFDGFVPIKNEVIDNPRIEVGDDDCVGRLMSRENYPITIRYDGGKIVVSPREIKRGIVKNLINEKIPKGITFIKDF